MARDRGRREAGPTARDEVGSLLASTRRGLGLSALVAMGMAVFGLSSFFPKPGASPLEPSVSQRSASSVTEVVGFELPVDVNERVDRWIRGFLNEGRSGFEKYLAREGLYGAIIRGKLRERGMPEDLIYMAMIESGLSPWATSPVSAAGMWQFMGPTAEAYGLRVTDWVDERRDPVRATDAALDYLQDLHDLFGSWPLAAAAYNAGPARVARAVSRHVGDTHGDEDLYWEIVDVLPRETREYVPKIIAATYLARNADQFGFEVERDEPYRFERVFVPGGTSLWSVARALDTPHRLLLDLNPHLIRGVTPPGMSYPVRVPLGGASKVVAHLGRASGSHDRWLDD